MTTTRMLVVPVDHGQTRDGRAKKRNSLAFQRTNVRSSKVGSAKRHAGHPGSNSASGREQHFFGDRARALSALAPHLPEVLKAPVVTEALAAAREIKHESSRVHALSELAPHLPELLRPQILSEALVAVFGLSNARDSMLQRIVTAWLAMRCSGLGINDLHQALHRLATRPRYEILSDIQSLIPLIHHLGGTAAIVEVFYAFRDVGCWWP